MEKLHTVHVHTCTGKCWWILHTCNCIYLGSCYFVTFAYYFNTYSVILLKYQQSVVHVTVDNVKYNKRFNNTCLWTVFLGSLCYLSNVCVLTCQIILLICHIFTCLRMPNVSMVPCPICAIQLKNTYFWYFDIISDQNNLIKIRSSIRSSFSSCSDKKKKRWRKRSGSRIWF